MPLDPSKLHGVTPLEGGGYIAQCPACAQEGRDSGGVHLREFPGGAYACVAHPGDHAHRQIIWSFAGDRSSRSTPSRSAILRRNIVRKARRASRTQTDAILEEPWDPKDIARASPIPIPEPGVAQALAIVALFRPLDTVWIGGHYDSGQPRHARHFRTAREWLRGGVITGPRICPASFVPGVIARAARTVRHWRFLVVESDSLSKPQQGAVIRWLRDLCHYRLRAVVDTGGRSLHAWFDHPSLREVEFLKACFPKLDIDAAVLQPAQPCRLPGWPRDDSGTLPTLIYLAP